MPHSTISADTHFLSLSGTMCALSGCFLRLCSAALKKCCKTYACSQLQCLHNYHGANFFKNGTNFSKNGTFYKKNGPKRNRFYKKEGTFTRKRDLKGARARAHVCLSTHAQGGPQSRNSRSYSSLSQFTSQAQNWELCNLNFRVISFPKFTSRILESL